MGGAASSSALHSHSHAHSHAHSHLRAPASASSCSSSSSSSCKPAGPRSTLLLLPAQPRADSCHASASLETPGATPSTSSSSSSSQLQEVLLQLVCSRELRRFVSVSWRPGAESSRSEDAQFVADGCSIALNFIDFVHEATDFAEIPECGFQYYRACHIFEKFLMHGASRPVPLRGASSRVVDDCSAALYGGRADVSSSCSCSLFSVGVTAAMDFLLAEVVPTFEHEVPLHALQRCLCKKLMQELCLRSPVPPSPKQVHPILKDRAPGNVSAADWADALDVIVLGPEIYRSAFSSFAASSAESRLSVLLDALVALLSTQELIVALKCRMEQGTKEEYEEPGAAAELCMVAFLHHLHRFYETYMLCPPHLRGDPSYLQLADATKGDFLLSVAKCGGASPDVLVPIKMDILQQLSKGFAKSFVDSAEHMALVRAGHVMFRDAAPKSNPEMIDDLEDLDVAMEVKGGSRGPSTSPLVSVAQMKKGNLTEEEKLCEEIVHLLGSRYDYIFGQYLGTVHHELPLMHFCQSVLRYQEMSKFLIDSTGEITQCTNIFERYLSRNAIEQMKLPDYLTNGITRLMFQPDAFIFSEALRFVLRYLAQHRWCAFKKAVGTSRIDNTHKKQIPTTCQQGSIGSTQLNSMCLGYENLHQNRDLNHIQSSMIEDLLSDEASDGDCSVDQETPSGRKSSLISRKDGKKYTDGVSLEDIMSRSQCLTIFKSYLDAEGTSQTLLFLIEVDEFQKIPEIGFQQTRARKIFFKFIHSKAIMAVPISHSSRKIIEKEFTSDEISALIFTKAIQEVKRFVECNQFPRFMQSAAAQIVTNIMTDEIDTSDTSTDEENYIPYLWRKPSHEGALDNWESKSLEDMVDFRLLLKYPTAVRFFKDFCVRTHCNENLFFWLDADNYTKLPGRVALKLSNKYINVDAKLQVNISGQARLRILKELSSASRLVFQQAQQEVFILMQTGTYPAFLNSPEFAQLKNYFQASASSSL